MKNQDRINQIVKEQYNDFRGSVFAALKPMHDGIRREFGDDTYLDFLERSVRENPRPAYDIPKEFYKFYEKKI